MFFDLHFSKLVTLCNARIIKKKKATAHLVLAASVLVLRIGCAVKKEKKKKHC